MEGFLLGGDRVAGSDCKTIPLRDYVSPYFRCTGATRGSAQVRVLSNTNPTACYEDTLEYVNAARVHAFDTVRDPRRFDETTEAALRAVAWAPTADADHAWSGLEHAGAVALAGE